MAWPLLGSRVRDAARWYVSGGFDVARRIAGIKTEHGQNKSRTKTERCGKERILENTGEYCKRFALRSSDDRIKSAENIGREYVVGGSY